MQTTKIPSNIEECIEAVKEIAPQVIKMFLDCEDEYITYSYHFNFGMYLRNNWHLWHKNKLTKYFNDLGITHADDMSSIILISTYRSVHNRKINLKQQVKYYQDFWKTKGRKNESIH
jgi:hypothetical protein